MTCWGRGARLLLRVGTCVGSGASPATLPTRFCAPLPARQAGSRRPDMRIYDAVLDALLENGGRIGQLVVVTPLGGGGTAMFGGGRGGGGSRLSPLEQRVASSGVPYLLIRAAPSDRVTDRYGEEANVVVEGVGGLPAGLSASRSQVRELPGAVGAAYAVIGVQQERHLHPAWNVTVPWSQPRLLACLRARRWPPWWRRPWPRPVATLSSRWGPRLLHPPSTWPARWQKRWPPASRWRRRRRRRRQPPPPCPPSSPLAAAGRSRRPWRRRRVGGAALL